jgi:hypothetical protein
MQQRLPNTFTPLRARLCLNHAGKFLWMCFLEKFSIFSEREKGKLFLLCVIGKFNIEAAKSVLNFFAVENFQLQIWCEGTSGSIFALIKKVISEKTRNIHWQLKKRGKARLEKQIKPQNVGASEHDRRAIKNYLSN